MNSNNYLNNFANLDDQTSLNKLKNVTNQIATANKYESNETINNSNLDINKTTASKIECDEENNENSGQAELANVEMRASPTHAEKQEAQLRDHKTHRKQQSMSDESFQQLTRNSSELSGKRRAIKKTRSSTNPKTYQTQSLSNITSQLHHSTSDNEIDHSNAQSSNHHFDQQSQQQQPHLLTMNSKNSNVINSQEFLIGVKDDLSYTSEDNLHEAMSTDKVKQFFLVLKFTFCSLK